jgi:hypothetical protein
MSKGTSEIASGAVREIESELRELFTKVVELDPQEAVRMLEGIRTNLWFRCWNC